jgi:hypothetical protein
MTNLRDKIEKEILDMQTWYPEIEEEDIERILNKIKAMTDDELLKTYTKEIILDEKGIFSNLEYNVKLKTNNTKQIEKVRPYVQEIIDLTKQVDDLTSDNVDLKEQLDYEKSLVEHVREVAKDGEDILLHTREIFKKEKDILEKQKEILWEYISDKDVDEISARLNEL